MPFLYVKQTVEDFDKWYTIFNSHSGAQQDAGLKDVQLFKDNADPNIIVCLFKVDDIEKARAFTESPEAENAKGESGMIGEPEVLWLNEI